MNQSSKILILILFSSVLSGCASPEQRAAYEREQQEQARQMEQSRVAALRNKCLQYGFKSGTTQFAQCLQQAEQQEAMNNAIRWQQNQEVNRERQEAFKRAQCHFTGRMDC